MQPDGTATIKDSKKLQENCFYSAMDLNLVTVSPKVPKKSAIQGQNRVRFPEGVNGRPASLRGFGGLFPEVPVLASESGTDSFIERKTGLFGAVWIEDRMGSPINYG